MRLKYQEKSDPKTSTGGGSSVRRKNDLSNDKMTNICDSYAKGQPVDYDGWGYCTEKKLVSLDKTTLRSDSHLCLRHHNEIMRDRVRNWVGNSKAMIAW